jgi:DNA-binding transcriptional LysR family regulator
VRVTSTDSLCHCVLAPIVARLRVVSPELTVELMCSNRHLDLGRTDADIAVRPATDLPDDLVGEVAAVLGFGLYRARGLDSDDWIGLSGPLARSRVGRWIDATVGSARIVVRADSFVVAREFAAAGMGLAAMPDFLGAEDLRLERVEGILPDLPVDIWVASHADLAHVPRIAAARRQLTEALAGQAERLRGRGA